VTRLERRAGLSPRDSMGPALRMALLGPAPRVRSRQEVVGLMLFLSPNENNKALASRDDVAVLKARIVQSPLAGCFRLLPF
jgi:hypothetical protein